MLSRDPAIQGGALCFTGTRVLVESLDSFVREGFSAEEIQSEYPTLTLEQIKFGMRIIPLTPGCMNCTGHAGSKIHKPPQRP